MSVETFTGARYFVSFIDDFTGYILIVPIKLKSQVLDQFKLYQAWLERKHDCRINRLHSDNGGEYVAMKGYLAQQGIEQSMSPPYCPNQNAAAERANRTIVEFARSMLQYASLSIKFWAEAVVHSARIRNLFLCPGNQTNTSYELMIGSKPDVSYLRIFGCRGWYHIPKDVGKKLGSKSEAGIVVGCLPNSQYKLWIPARGTALIARDVTIDETAFPARQLMQNQRDTANRLILNGEDADDAQQPGRKEQLTWENIDQSAVQGSTDVMHAEPQPTPAHTDEQLEAVTHYPAHDDADHISQ